MFEAAIREGVMRLRRPGTRFLSTGADGGLSEADAAYNMTVPDGWERTDVSAYAAERRRRAGFGEAGPTLLTGVDLDHARGARSGAVEAYATVGLSNPAALPMEPSAEERSGTTSSPAGTVNLVVGTTHALGDAALAGLLAVAVEAKAATLLAETGFPGTTTDAVIAACDPEGEAAAFAGSATPVGAAARACVREAVGASLRSRYPDGEFPASVAEAEYGVSTERRAGTFEVARE